MPQIREIKKRIKSVTSTQKVTHAMELVSAAKMRKAQATALAGRPYTSNLAEILSTVQVSSTETSHVLLKPNNAENKLVIIVTSDRGLAGGLNLNIFREILKSFPATQQPSHQKNKYITVGKKARDFAAKTGSDLLESYESEQIPFLSLARILTKTAIGGYLNGQYSQVSLIYPHFESTIKQTPTWIQLLPIMATQETAEKTTAAEFLFEPTADTILESILVHHVLTQIYQVLVESKASEHSARMVAMKNATDAADDLVEDLTLTYNQARQEAITKELLDITTAQKAFE